MGTRFLLLLVYWEDDCVSRQQGYKNVAMDVPFEIWHLGGELE